MAEPNFEEANFDEDQLIVLAQFGETLTERRMKSSPPEMQMDINTWNTFGEFDDALDRRRHVSGQRRPGGYPSGFVRHAASRRIVGVPTFVHHLPHGKTARVEK